MAFFEFGTFDPQRGYATLDERVVRGSSGLLLVLGFIAFENGFVVKNYPVLPWISGFLALNFLIAVAVNPRFSPTMAISRFMVRRQSPLPIGAVQKRFAWSVGLAMSVAIFVMSLLLQSDETWFDAVCQWCLVCLLFLFLETAFGICVGCKIYALGIRLGLIKAPVVRPNCMGDACEVD